MYYGLYFKNIFYFCHKGVLVILNNSLLIGLYLLLFLEWLDHDLLPFSQLEHFLIMLPQLLVAFLHLLPLLIDLLCRLPIEQLWFLQTLACLLQIRYQLSGSLLLFVIILIHINCCQSFFILVFLIHSVSLECPDNFMTKFLIIIQLTLILSWFLNITLQNGLVIKCWSRHDCVRFSRSLSLIVFLFLVSCFTSLNLYRHRL